MSLPSIAQGPARIKKLFESWCFKLGIFGIITCGNLGFRVEGLKFNVLGLKVYGL